MVGRAGIGTGDLTRPRPVLGGAVVAALATAIFAMDWATPQGVAEGTLYAALVLASAWLPCPKAPLGAAAVATVLNAAGYWVSAEASAPGWFPGHNRVIAMAVIWTTALLLYRRLELERALAAAQARYRTLLTERALEESRDRYRQLVEASPDAIILHQDGVIRFVNPGALVLSGASDTTLLIGRPVRDLLPGARRADLEAPTGPRGRSEQSAGWTEQRLVQLDGDALDVEVGSVRIRVDGEWAVQTILRDISDAKAPRGNLLRPTPC